MIFVPLIWSGIRRKPTEAVLIWLAVTASFTLFGLVVGLHASYAQVIALGTAWALVLAIVGGFPPAVRATASDRCPVTSTAL
jgi:hypothetical protein